MKKIVLIFISSRDGPEKAQKQGRDERTQEDYSTSAVNFCRNSVVFLHSFISALLLCFFSGFSVKHSPLVSIVEQDSDTAGRVV